MDFTSAQRTAIELPTDLVVTAGAGSGKTRVLVERYLRLLTEGHEAASLLALTFTEKAAREMRERVRLTVAERTRLAPLTERPLWEERQAAVEAARIGTFHSFCATLLRDHPAETGLDPAFSLLDEAETKLLLIESIEATLNTEYATLEQKKSVLLEEFGPEELSALLAEMVQGGPEVKAALAAMPPTPAALVAYWRTQLSVVQAEVGRDLLTDPNWQTAQMTLLQLAAFASQADLLGKQVLGLAKWLMEESKKEQPNLLFPFKIDLRGGSKKNWRGEGTLEEAKKTLRTLRETYALYAPLLELVPAEALEERTAQAVLDLCELYRAVGKRYKRDKEQENQLDFDDLIVRTRELLEQDPTVRNRWQAELQAILVDEFQDTDDEQRAILTALTNLTKGGPKVPQLFIVGDGKQSIYRFRGADVRVFQAVAQEIVQKGGQIVPLQTSFRTHPPLLNWLNQVTEALFARPRALQPYEVPFEPLQQHRETPSHPHSIELHILARDETLAPPVNAIEGRKAEAKILAERLQFLTAGRAGKLIFDKQEETWRIPTFADIALLFQASTVFEYYEQALREQGIPFLTTAGRGYYGRKEVQDLIHLMQVLNDPQDKLALVGVLRSPLFALADEQILHLHLKDPKNLWNALLTSQGNEEKEEVTFARETLHELYTLRGKLKVGELLREALSKTGYLATISGLTDGERRRVNVEKLLEVARQKGSSLSNYSAYLASLNKTESREGEAPLEAEGSVRLMTVHRSKGLEFPIVVLPDLGRDVKPNLSQWLAHRTYGLGLKFRNRDEQPLAYLLALAEEKQMEQAERERLLYVALTRARDYLILSGPAAKKSGPNWLSWILGALGWAWEQDGPPKGLHYPLEVWHHIQPVG